MAIITARATAEAEPTTPAEEEEKEVSPASTTVVEVEQAMPSQEPSGGDKCE